MACSGLRRAVGRGGGLGRPRFSSQFTRIGGAVIRVGGAVIRVGGAVIRIGGAVIRIGGAVIRVGGAVTRIGGAVTRTGGAATRIGGAVTRAGGAAARIGCAVTRAGVIRGGTCSRAARRIGLHIEIARARHRRTSRPTGNVRRYGSRRFRHYSPTRRVPLEPEKYVILTVALPPC